MGLPIVLAIRWTTVGDSELFAPLRLCVMIFHPEIQFGPDASALRYPRPEADLKRFEIYGNLWMSLAPPGSRRRLAHVGDVEGSTPS